MYIYIYIYITYIFICIYRGVSSSTQDPGGRLTTFLAVRNERQPAVRKCRVDCLSCPNLSRSLEVKSNITGRTYSSINIESHEIHCKITVHIQ